MERLAEFLRGAGVAVWFDKAVLVSGVVVLAIVLGLKGSPIPWLMPPLMPASRAVVAGISTAEVMLLTVWALVWTVIVLTGYIPPTPHPPLTHARKAIGYGRVRRRFSLPAQFRGDQLATMEAKYADGSNAGRTTGPPSRSAGPTSSLTPTRAST